MRAGRTLTIVLALFLPASTLAARKPALPALPRLSLIDSFPIVQRQVREAEAGARANPLDPAANGKLAMVLDAYDQYAAAAVCYRRAHLLDPKSFGWLYGLGWVEFKQGQYDEAAEALRGALKLRGDYLPARLKLAECLLAEGQFEAAAKLYQEIIQKDQDSAEANYGLGRAEAAEGRTEEAEAPLERACELFPQYGTAQYALALAYRKLGEAKKAEAHFALYKANVTTAPPAIDPLRADVQQLNQGPLALTRRGVDLAQTGDLEGAIREHLKAIEIDPRDAQAHINLIQLYARTGDYEKAEQEYRTAISMNPNRADGYYNYGVMMFQLKKFPEAEKAFRRTIEINPYDAEAHNDLGVLLEIRGKLDEALGEFEKAVEDRPDFRLAHFQIGRILVNQKKYPEAIREFLKTLTAEDERTPGYLYALGVTYARAGDLEDGLRYLRQAREQAQARGQTELLASINRDLSSLEQESKPH